ncbi:P-type ATPase [Cavenderia fasciculata]|uniref:Phospholipid-transporting ATPase n=1 Tax=Cavenderia fasciculata TaxID=261658 RepID=F4PY90_CACFS|nr:P-type ATPase [Cavenderia fasciculata]EGG19357.1 P-type ATPase [Cavenderia fasciculata]|eukprot:XP_004357628.1 P-type ATPase [Cavenderia fasciculata]
MTDNNNMWYHRVVQRLGLMKPEDGPTIRIVYANDAERNIEYPTNVISNTKYTLVTFIPKNLYEQFGRSTRNDSILIQYLFIRLFDTFRRAMNIYFLFIGILQLFPSITPVNPVSTWGALVFIFTVSAIKEGYDDFNRYKRDKLANERQFWVLRNNARVQIQSQHISVGDIICLQNNDEIPCDMVVLATSDPEGTCYVQTANLDGETDLKTRLAPKETMGMSEQELHKFKGVIECPSPNAEIYKFDSRLSMQANTKVNTYTHSNWITLSAQNILLQATNVRNVDHLYGMAVYTGNETKIGKNKKIPPTKWTKLDHSINRITVFIFCLQLSLVLIFGMIGEFIRSSEKESVWYLGYTPDYKDPWYEFIIIPLRFLLLNSLMIPISLKVTIDVIKYAYALFINWDLKMYYKQSNAPAVANSTALSEDLGQIEYVFTDKTGTLTENIMLFSRCSIDGQVYGVEGSIFEDQSLLEQINSNDHHSVNFFRAISLCHSVIPSRSPEDNSIFYKASSPDEEALVTAASKLGIQFTNKTPSALTIQVNDTIEHYQLLHTFDFTSDRKRMSVIVKHNATNQIKIITKGADDMVFKRLHKNNDIKLQIKHIDEFAMIGLRTLCIAERVLDENVYNSWLENHFKEASCSLENRQERLAEAYELLECNLDLLGVTAIEDKLQEGVPETIHNLRQASIKVWMLTGDKYSTAIQIAHSCNLVERGCRIYTIGKEIPRDDHEDDYSTGVTRELSALEIVSSIRDIQDHILTNGGNYDLDNQSSSNNIGNSNSNSISNRDVSIAVEGHVLTTVLKFAESEFLQLSGLVSSVICCRVTPNQKALVVRMVKNTNKICLAIGDGGNDVSMIQEANVGVGIGGREGLQAARASDYSIARFKYLQDLLFIHGRYSYLRTSFVANYCFYKSLFICFIQILYQIFSGFAGTTFFNSFSLTSYNILFTGLPIIGYILDRDLPQSILKRNPYLYTFTQEGKAFSPKIFLRWSFRSLYHALIVFCATAAPFIYNTGGTDIDYDSISMISFTAIIFIQSLTLFIESNTITWINHALIWGTIPIYILCVLVLNSISTLDMYSVMTHLTDRSSFWGSFFLMICVCLVPIISIEYLLQLYKPTVDEIINQIRSDNHRGGFGGFFNCTQSTTSLNDGDYSPPSSSTSHHLFSSNIANNNNNNNNNDISYHSGNGNHHMIRNSSMVVPEEHHNQRSKIITFLLYRSLTTPLAKRLSRRKIRGNKEVIELIVNTYEDTYDDDHNQSYYNSHPETQSLLRDEEAVETSPLL